MRRRQICASYLSVSLIITAVKHDSFFHSEIKHSHLLMIVTKHVQLTTLNFCEPVCAVERLVICQKLHKMNERLRKAKPI